MRAGQVDYFIRPSKRRRGYGKEILRLGLDKFRERGMQRILISCASDNSGSRKIIEANGGVFENEIPSWDPYGTSGIRRRYWIDLT
jgi:predicted acetyltransferase